MQISEYLKKFTRLTPPKRHIQAEVARILAETFHIHVEAESVSASRSALFISAPAAFKSELQLHKQGVLEKINEQLSPRSFTDIR